jgi:oxygen-independent coproporphyrinogen-3 oxidase
VKKCPYCSFNSYKIDDFINIEYWKQAYLTAINFYANRYPQKVVKTIYLGGGTPSLLPNSFVDSILTEIFSSWKVEEDVEISIEVNPHSSNREKLHGFAQSKINRVSIGVQSFLAEGLVLLGRTHNVEAAIEAINLSSKLFKSVSADIIYGHPGHSVEIWNEELDLALTIPIQHLSAYQLTVESNTVFGNMYKQGELLLPSEDECADMFELTQKKMENAGFLAYEISNHAIPTHECRHNVRYWQYQDYIGIGPGAHGRISEASCKYATLEEADPRKWASLVMANGAPPMRQEKLSLAEQAREALLMGLRMPRGLDCSALPLALEQFVRLDALQALVDGGFLEHSDNILRATKDGLKRLNPILLMLL